MATGAQGRAVRRALPERAEATSWACGTASDGSRSARPHLRRASRLTKGPPKSSIELRGRGYPGNPGPTVFTRKLRFVGKCTILRFY